MATAPASTSHQLGPVSVIVCAIDSLSGERIASVITEAGHEYIGSVESVGLAASNGWGEADCLVLAARRLTGATRETIALLHEQLPDTKIVVACDRGSRTEVRRSLKSGAAGVVALDRVDEVLPSAISAVCAGQVCVPATHRDSLADLVLTSREKQILGLVVMGMTNAEIAAKLFLAESTIKSHLSSAFAKLGVSSRSEAAALILDPNSGAGLGILTIPTK